LAFQPIASERYPLPLALAVYGEVPGPERIRRDVRAGFDSNPVQALFSSVQTFPLSYQSPLARLSVRITEKVRWNAGWQFYNYHEEFGLLGWYQNYHANTGYTSVLWSF
jgi:hypothetical protein